MLSPFPGMNPYLENPEIWPEVHHLLILSYTQAPIPPISAEDQAWIEQILQFKG